VGLENPHRKHFLLLQNVSKRLGPGLTLWHDLSDGKRQETWYLERRSLYRAGAIKSVVAELEKCTLALVGVQRTSKKRRDIKQQTYIFQWKRECYSPIRDKIFCT
jgi:hypothetical protein